MKQPTFTEKQLYLIGECVLDSIMQLRVSRQNIAIEEARMSLQPTIDNLNEILTILAEACHEK